MGDTNAIPLRYHLAKGKVGFTHRTTPPGPYDRAAPDLPALRVAQGVRLGNGPLDRFLIRLTPHGTGASLPPLGSGAALCGSSQT